MSTVDPSRGSRQGTKRSSTPTPGKGGKDGKGKKGKSKEAWQSYADDLSTRNGALSCRAFTYAQVRGTHPERGAAIPQAREATSR